MALTIETVGPVELPMMKNAYLSDGEECLEWGPPDSTNCESSAELAY
jgi:hypothetical protein